MKKFLNLAMVAALLFSLTGCNSEKEEAKVSEPVQKETWIMAINATFPPFESIDAENPGKFVGVDIDIANHIAEKLGIVFEIKDMQFSALVPTMESGRADIIISGISPTAERKKVISFTDSYFFPLNAIISKKGANYTSLDSLEGKKIGVSLGTSYANVAKTVANAEVVELDNTPLIVQEILNGRVDAGIFDATQAATFVKEYEGIESFVIPSDISIEDTFAIALPKDSEHIASINKILAEMISDGTLTAILEKHIGKEAVSQYLEQLKGLKLAQ